MAIPTKAPTNKKLLKNGLHAFWLVTINMTAIRFGRYLLYLYTGHPRPLSDYTFTELVLDTEMLNVALLFVLLVIMCELSFNGRDEARRPMNLYYKPCIRASYLTSFIHSLVR